MAAGRSDARPFARRAGHQLYFVIVFRDPEPGQTLPDVCTTEQQFVHEVPELHPDSPKPAIVGNWQRGWAAMMAVAADQDSHPSGCHQRRADVLMGCAAGLSEWTVRPRCRTGI